MATVSIGNAAVPAKIESGEDGTVRVEHDDKEHDGIGTLPVSIVVVVEDGVVATVEVADVMDDRMVITEDSAEVAVVDGSEVKGQNILLISANFPFLGYSI